MKSKNIRTRFAPSPTGNLHIGSARTALFNYLFAKQNKGKFILRIEDTDKERSKKEFEEDIVENLQWLGLEWDEEYRQSQRTKVYEKYLKKLLKEKRAYYCFCTKEELEDMKQEQMSRGEAPKYSGKCRNLSEKEIENNLKQGKNYIIRFKVEPKKIKFNDLIRQEVEFDTGLIGDIAIAKDEKTPLYNFSVVVDDNEMKISHVIRGEDLLPNTPKQILLQEALDFTRPEYAHLPLILGPDKSKMSKRHGATSIKEYAEQGYLAEAVINFLAFLGWNPGDEREIFSLASLKKEFSLEKIQKHGAIFNIKRLDYLNGFYIRRKPLEELTELCIPFLIKAGLITPVFKEDRYPATFGGSFISSKFILENREEIDFEYIKKVVFISQERLKILSEIEELTDFFFKEELDYKKDLLKWKNMTDEDIVSSIDKSINILSDIKKWTKENIEKELLKNTEGRGELLWPLRVALSGKKASPPPFEIAEILGGEKTLKRLNRAKKICQK
jgi:glutamyl-tRNA synthetase